MLISDIDTAWLRDPTPFSGAIRTRTCCRTRTSSRARRTWFPSRRRTWRSTSRASTRRGTDDEGLELHICRGDEHRRVVPEHGGQPRVTDEWVKLIEAKDELWDRRVQRPRASGRFVFARSRTRPGLMGFRGKILVSALPPPRRLVQRGVFTRRGCTAEKRTRSPCTTRSSTAARRGRSTGCARRMSGAVSGLCSSAFCCVLADGKRNPSDSCVRAADTESVDLAIFRERSWPGARSGPRSDHRVRSRPGGRGAREAGGVSSSRSSARRRRWRRRSAEWSSRRPSCAASTARGSRTRAIPGIAVFFAVRVSLRPRPRGGAVTKDGRVARALVFDTPGASRVY